MDQYERQLNVIRYHGAYTRYHGAYILAVYPAKNRKLLKTVATLLLGQHCSMLSTILFDVVIHLIAG